MLAEAFKKHLPYTTHNFIPAPSINVKYFQKVSDNLKYMHVHCSVAAEYQIEV
jgi:hypothetical protein